MGQNETPTTLSAKQQRFLAALLSERTVEAAATSAGVARATAYRWLGEPVFQDALKGVEQQVLESTSRGLISLSAKALAVIEELLDDDEVPANTRLRAADSTLNRLLQLRELVTLESRIAALEARLERSEIKS